MARTTPKMGLRLWDQLVDLYDHNQGADNLSKIDFHDHTPGRGVPIPTQGIANGAVSFSQLDPNVVTDYGYAYAQWKDHARSLAGTAIGGALAAGTFLMLEPPTAGGATGAFYVNSAERAAGSRTVFYRLTTEIIPNATTPGGTFTVTLYPVTATTGSSGSAAAGLTLGAAVANATVTATPAGATPALVISTNTFTLAAGFYALQLTTSTLTAANSYTSVRAILQYQQQ